VVCISTLQTSLDAADRPVASTLLRTRHLCHARGHRYQGLGRLLGPDMHWQAALSLTHGYVTTPSSLSQRPRYWAHSTNTPSLQEIRAHSSCTRHPRRGDYGGIGVCRSTEGGSVVEASDSRRPASRNSRPNLRAGGRGPQRHGPTAKHHVANRLERAARYTTPPLVIEISTRNCRPHGSASASSRTGHIFSGVGRTASRGSRKTMP